MSIRDKFKVPGIKTTDFVKRIEIENYVAEYTELLAQIKDITKDISQYEEQNLKITTHLEYLAALKEKRNIRTAELLGIKQGLMNVSNPDKSMINGKRCKTKDEFERFKKISIMIGLAHLLNSSEEANISSLPGTNTETISDLIDSNGTSLKSEELIQTYPILKTFFQKLREVNHRTGYSSGKYPSVSFNIEEQETGDIEITILQKGKTDKTLAH